MFRGEDGTWRCSGCRRPLTEADSVCPGCGRPAFRPLRRSGLGRLALVLVPLVLVPALGAAYAWFRGGGRADRALIGAGAGLVAGLFALAFVLRAERKARPRG